MTRILIAGFKHETNTFSAVPTDLDSYRARALYYGDMIAEQLRGTIDPGKSAEELASFVRAGLTALESFKHSSGGMTLWPGARSPSPVATAYAMEAAALAGQQPSEDTIRFLRRFLDGNWMQRWWSEQTRRSAQARVALHLARVGRGEPGYNANLYQHRQSLSLTAQAELAEARRPPREAPESTTGREIFSLNPLKLWPALLLRFGACPPTRATCCTSHASIAPKDRYLLRILATHPSALCQGDHSPH